jgi:hypothetical protein
LAWVALATTLTPVNELVAIILLGVGASFGRVPPRNEILAMR